MTTKVSRRAVTERPHSYCASSRRVDDRCRCLADRNRQRPPAPHFRCLDEVLHSRRITAGVAFGNGWRRVDIGEGA